MPQVGFEPAISEVERPQTYALDRAATGDRRHYVIKIYSDIGIWQPRLCSVESVHSVYNATARGVHLPLVTYSLTP